MQPVRHFDFAELKRFAARYDQSAMKGWLKELLARNGSHAFAVPAYEPLLARRIRAVIEAGRPASCLRLGDGEGNLLGACDGEFRNLQRLCAQKAAEMHLGRWLGGSALETLSRATFAAVANADVIGVPCTGRIRSLDRKLRDAKRAVPFDIRGACGTINALRYAHKALSSASPDRVITSCWFHRGLLPFYREVLRGTSRIGLISCHSQLPTRLRAAFGAEDVTFFPIPNQVSNTGKRPVPPHYPDIFEKVMQSLSDIREGQLVLVAAGILGKIYCNRVKQCGGIALDIGSVADVWMGQRARRHHGAAYLGKWAISGEAVGNGRLQR
ncbi:MAG TPA: hypothetical protein VHY79_14880 [Rhizomicrobium sp.]|jgi:hypothetical protein|nr:hypothetical protein [Rhizomicrobium sp.]